MRSLPLALFFFSLTTTQAQTTTPPISLNGEIYLAQNTQQSPNPNYYRPVAPQAQQAPCGGFSTPPCTGQTLTPTGPTGEQLFLAARKPTPTNSPSNPLPTSPAPHRWATAKRNTL
jgi:hypothetical protein